MATFDISQGAFLFVQIMALRGALDADTVIGSHIAGETNQAVSQCFQIWPVYC